MPVWDATELPIGGGSNHLPTSDPISRWARAVARDPNGTTAADVDRLRAVGFTEPQLFALTLFTALRMALSMTNDALGARPDLALAELLDPAILDAITWGRPPA